MPILNTGKTMMRLPEIVEKAKLVPGAISVTEMVAIHNLVLHELRAIGRLWAIDLGAHAGKSTMMASSAMSDMGRSDLFCMVDLIYDLDNKEWWNTFQGAAAKRDGNDVKHHIPWPIAKDPLLFLNIIGWHNSVSNLVVKLFGRSSLQFLDEHNGPFSYAFVDTDDHQAELVMAEAKALEDEMALGALIIFHDYGNYRGPVLAGEYLVSTGKYVQIKVDWKSADTIVEQNNLEGGNDSWAGPHHKYLGCFRRIK